MWCKACKYERNPGATVVFVTMLLQARVMLQGRLFELSFWQVIITLSPLSSISADGPDFMLSLLYAKVLTVACMSQHPDA